MITLKKKHIPHIDKKLVFRLRIYFIISLILICVVLFEVFSGHLQIFLALIGLLIGIILGVITARMFILSWDNDAKKVISKLDYVGGIILIVYIIFSFFRNTLIGNFVQANYVTGTSIAIATGVMIGRVFGTGRKIVSLLREQNLLIK